MIVRAEALATVYAAAIAEDLCPGVTMQAFVKQLEDMTGERAEFEPVVHSLDITGGPMRVPGLFPFD